METIQSEFYDFLNELIKTYPKGNVDVMQKHSARSNESSKSKDFLRKAKNKINDLILKNPQVDIKEIHGKLSAILAEYHSILIVGEL